MPEHWLPGSHIAVDADSLVRIHFKHFLQSGIYSRVRTLIKFLVALLLPALAQAQITTTHATLLLAATEAKPGDTVLAGVRFQMEEGWHIYWRNPGGPGLPTEIKWELPAGVTAGAIQWPTPEKFVMADESDPTAEKIINYGYGHEVTLLVPLKLASDLKPGTLEIRGAVDWLACKVSCIPGSKELNTKLIIASETKRSADADALQNVQASLPKAGDSLAPRASWEKPASGDTRPLLIEWNSAIAASEPDFFGDASDKFEVPTATELVNGSGNQLKLRKLIKKSEGDWPTEISGLIIQKAGDQIQGYEVKLAIGGATTSSPAAMIDPTAEHSIWFYVLNAFLGGLILNIMPCVLPVIALKILGFVNQAKDSPGAVRRLGMIYTAGVLVSFLVLALVIVGLKALGNKVAWGFQFSNPFFVIAMTTLVVLIALNLFGVFEIAPGGSALTAASELSSKSGGAGAFFNGLFATLLATSCSAPVLGGAIGYAFAKPPHIIVLIFLMVGLGLASPYLVLSWQPAWLRFLPKPGTWMEKFKMAMGFPMLAAGLWMMNLLTDHYGERTWWFGMFLLILATAAWVFGEFVQRGRNRKSAALVFVLVLVAVAYTWALETNMEWRVPIKAGQAAVELKNAPKNYPWKAWSRDAVAKARAEKKIVLVDFTAKWCLTCNTVVKTALENRELLSRMKELGVEALLADYTATPPAITEELARHQRAGVPLVLVYPRDATQPAIVLPEALTAGMVLDALKQATN